MIEIDGRTLSLEDVEAVAMAGSPVALSEDGRERLDRAFRYVQDRVASGDRIYGVNTGFGRLAETVIPPERTEELQRNLVRSDAAGVGAAIPVAEVRAMMLLRANALARGNSGCRAEGVDRRVDFLNQGLHPWVPGTGSVGASGDLAPLAHVALALIGEGDLVVDGGRRPVAPKGPFDR